MSKCLALDTITVSFKDGTMLQVTANNIKHACVNDTHVIEAKFEPSDNYNYSESRTYSIKDQAIEEIVQTWHMRKAEEVK